MALETGLAAPPLGQRHAARPAEDLQPEVRRRGRRAVPARLDGLVRRRRIAPEKRGNWCVSTPDFFAGAAALLDSEPLAALAGLAGHARHQRGRTVPVAAFVDANFAFYGTTLSGTPRNKDRWKRGVAVVEAALGEAVGQIYVARHFPETHKARMESLVGNLIEAYRRSITGWTGWARRPSRGAEEAGDVPRQDRLPGQVDRLLGGGDRARRPARQRGARATAPTSTVTWTRWASRWTGTSG